MEERSIGSILFGIMSARGNGATHQELMKLAELKRREHRYEPNQDRKNPSRSRKPQHE